MKRIDRLALWAVAGAAAWIFVFSRLPDRVLGAALTLAFLFCLNRTFAYVSVGKRATQRRAKKTDLDDAKRYLLALSLEESETVLRLLRPAFEAEYGISTPERFEEGLLYEAAEETVFVAALARHPSCGSVDAQSLANVYRAMRRSSATKAVLLATCPCGKLPPDERLSSIKVLGGDILAHILAKHSDTIDRAILPKREKSARSKKLRALGRAMRVPPSTKQCALHAGYAALLLATYIASKSPVALACMAFQLLRIGHGLLAMRKTAPPRLF